MLIEKDKYLNMWVVWLINGNLHIDVFKNKYKKACKEWVKDNEKRIYRKLSI